MQLRTSLLGSITLFACLVSAPVRAQTYAIADFLVPHRNMSENVFQRNQTEVTDAMGMGTGMFIAGPAPRLVLNLDEVAAGRITAGHQGDVFGVEGTYLRTDTWDTMATAADAAGMLASPFTRVGAAVNPAVDNNTFAMARYQTELESLELSMTQLLDGYWLGDAAVLFGVRAMRVDETFMYSSTNAMMMNDLLSTANNQLIGPQLGLRSQTPAPGGFVSALLKVALTYNETETVTVFNGVTARNSTGAAGVAGEVNLEYAFTPTPNTSIRIGCQFLAISEVGLATNPPIITPDQTDGVLYSAPYVGVVVVH